MKISHQDIAQAVQCIKSRYTEAAARLAELEAGLTNRVIRFSLGEISADDLNAEAGEMALLREICREDSRGALDHFQCLSNKLMEQQQHDRSEQEAKDRERELAIRWNEMLARNTAPTESEINELKPLMPSTINLYRLMNSRQDFAAQPVSAVTFGEFAGLAPIGPD